MNIRLATFADIPAILAISNHYALTTSANFAVEPEPLEQWQRDFEATREKYPWFVAVENSTPPPSLREGAGGWVLPKVDAHKTHPLTPSLEGRGKTIIGFAKASPWKGRCAYAYSAETTVYVAPGLHRRGVGRLLYATLRATLEQQGYRTLLGGITLPNDASVGLHESLGFRKVAELERVGWKFGRWHNVGYWELMLGVKDDPPGPLRAVRDVLAAPAPAS